MRRQRALEQPEQPGSGTGAATGVTISGGEMGARRREGRVNSYVFSKKDEATSNWKMEVGSWKETTGGTVGW
jgi:hypothetical protein